MQPFDVAPFFVRLGVGVFAAATTWFAANIAGRGVIRRLCPDLDSSARPSLGAALGYAIVGSVAAITAAFHAGRIGAVAMFGLLLIICVIALPSQLGQVRRAIRSMRDSWGRHTLVDRIAAVATLFALATAAVAGALPAVWWDPIAYHLPIAERMASSFGLAFDPAMTQTGFPLLGEAAALPAYAVGGSAGAALVTLGAGVTLALLCGTLAAAIDARARWLAVALVATSPLWVWLAPSFYVDIPFAMFVVAALAVALLGKPGEAQWSRPLLAGLLAGAAAAVKATGLGVALIALLLIVVVARRQRLRAAGAFALGFAALALPWYARSAVLTGDPVYPFLSASLGHTEAVRAFALHYADMTRQWCGGGYTAIDALLVPWRMLTEPRFFCGDPGYALRLSAIFFLAGLALVKKTLPLAVLSLALTAAWFAESHQDRFLVAAICLFAVVAAVGVANIREPLRAITGVTLVVLGAFGVLENWLPAFESDASSSVVPAFAYVAGAQGASQYLDARLESEAALSWVVSHVRRGERFLALDDVRDYYGGMAAVWGNPYYQPVWALDWSSPASARYAALRAAGFRYVVVNANRAYVGRTPTGIDWTALAADQRAGVIRRVFAQNDVEVFVLGASR